MGSDRARRSYDAGQKYRSVVSQQGRVTVEADGNEAEDIRAAEARAELVEIVGPAATPDDGFKISIPSPVPGGWIPFDLNIGKGTMYVGGVRITQAADTTYFGQNTGEWVEGPPAPGLNVKHELVYLALGEQEVSAVEDAALREVALGGPDTSARTRILQRVTRLAVDGDCGGALAAATAVWSKQGLDFDPRTSTFSSQARLRCDFVPEPGPQDLCQPTAQAGFLGPDNQLIRVQVAGDGKLLWGWDNASFLYRVTPVDSITLKLGAIPVDVFHQPRAKQWVEILAASAHLGNGEYMAAVTGFAVPLQTGYETVSQTVTLSLPLPAGLDKSPQLYLRIWENQLAFAGDDTTATELIDADGKGTGVRVYTKGLGVPGDFWLLGVRPDQPQQIFPPRYLGATPQPPDGPRRWATSLAVIAWNQGTGTVSDCRATFCPLVEACHENAQSGCCTVSLRPEDLGDKQTLQHVLDALADKRAGRVCICLGAGTYLLPEPLRLDRRHAGFTIEGCAAGATLAAAPGSEPKFIDGLVVLVHADNVTLRGLRLRLPLVPFAKAGGKLAGLSAATLHRLDGPVIEDLHSSIGVRPVHCGELTITDCVFRFELPPNASVFAAGIFAGSESWGWTIERNRFVHSSEYMRDPRGPLRFLAGLLVLPSTTITQPQGRRLGELAIVEGSTVPSVFADAVVTGNEFGGLSAAILVFGELGGVRLGGNTVRECYAGFLILALRTLGLTGGFEQVSFTKGTAEQAHLLRLAILGVNFDPVLEVGIVIGRSYPLPAGIDDKLHLRVAPTAEERALPEHELKARRDAAAAAEMKVLFDRLPGRAAGKQRAADTKPADTKPADTKPADTKPADTKPVDTEPLKFSPETLALGRQKRSGNASDIAALSDVLAAIERRALAQVPGDGRLRFTLLIEGNQISSVVPSGPSGPGLMIFDYDVETPSTIVVTSNVIRSEVPNEPSAWLLLVDRCTVTGNVIANEDPHHDGASMFLSSRNPELPAVAVTGNVFEAHCVLPSRSGVPAPLDRWDVLNTVIP